MEFNVCLECSKDLLREIKELLTGNMIPEVIQQSDNLIILIWYNLNFDSYFLLREEVDDWQLKYSSVIDRKPFKLTMINTYHNDVETITNMAEYESCVELGFHVIDRVKEVTLDSIFNSEATTSLTEFGK